MKLIQLREDANAENTDDIDATGAVKPRNIKDPFYRRNGKMKKMQARLIRRITLFTFAAVACAALPAPQAATPTKYLHPQVAECRAAFDASPAMEHCPNLIAHAYLSADPPCFYYGKCALTVPVDGSDTSFDLHIPGGDAVYISASDLQQLDVCFKRAADADGGQAGWTMNLKAGCAGDETDADTAKAEGLPQP
ncbi:MAG: hypothetical protein OXQ29_11015 [Rhodospirillaceae bacterium]|nr:hypothetical protein [Rhodospirillaceae bacterium]